MDETTEALEQLKRFAGFGGCGAADSRPYRCRGCSEAFGVQYHVCPECGGYSVELRRNGDGPP